MAWFQYQLPLQLANLSTTRCRNKTSQGFHQDIPQFQRLWIRIVSYAENRSVSYSYLSSSESYYWTSQELDSHQDSYTTNWLLSYLPNLLVSWTDMLRTQAVSNDRSITCGNPACADINRNKTGGEECSFSFFTSLLHPGTHKSTHTTTKLRPT